MAATVQVAKRSELHTFAVIPQRWVVERSFAWLEKCRRIWKNTERLLTRACSSSIWLFWPYYYEDIEQVLRRAGLLTAPDVSRRRYSISGAPSAVAESVD